jgi:diacylglycerol kinase (ATP)
MVNLKNKLFHALVGIGFSIKTQSSFRIQLVAGIIFILLELFFQSNNLITILIFISLILSMELFNTAIEKICDFIQPNLDPRIKLIKDISAGAVLIICLGFIIWSIKLYFPLLINFFISKSPVSASIPDYSVIL